MHLDLIHHTDSHLEGTVEGRPLFRYVFRPKVPKDESPKPYFHPLYSLAGDKVTAFRATDHPWHQGLSMTLTLVSGMNFWGGGTYRKLDRTYTMLANHGEQRHQNWDQLESKEEGFLMQERLRWIGPAGEPVFDEIRRIAFDLSSATEGYYTLSWSMALTNLTSRELVIGTYHSEEGLEGSHYTGLFFRGTREFLTSDGSFKPQSLGAGGANGEKEVHGHPGAWMALCGHHDESLHRTTLLFCDHPDNRGYPNRWFFRQNLPAVSFPFASTRSEKVAEGETLRLKYAIVVANGSWSADRCDTFHKTWSGARKDPQLPA